MYRLLILIFALTITSYPVYSQETQDKPKALHMERPAYPLSAFKNKVSGHVKFQYDIGADGRVNNVVITESVPPGIFDNEVKKSVLKWLYEKGKPLKGVSGNLEFKTN
ncbi:TonB family protein [Pantoea agglomerans]|uniref:TonB family protein n=1 Tax=Enterobacter agglomerans TaxID=549 RepID=UPI00155997A8|nr:TonB family protein [Pantoea agglomerans]NQS80560.1 TonB family protein [Pantoea agglomerans]